MGEIIESKRRHYVGDDADKNTIPAGAKAFGDSYHANDKGKQYYWNGTAWKTGLGYEYVPRAATTHDIDEGDLTEDGTWKIDGLDLSAIVPDGAKAVVLGVRMADDAANSILQIRQNVTAAGVVKNLTTQVANIEVEGHATLGIDSNRLMDYSASNLAFTYIRITVLGWYI